LLTGHFVYVMGLGEGRVSRHLELVRSESQAHSAAAVDGEGFNVAAVCPGAVSNCAENTSVDALCI
jgi:hypothetical protein